MGADIIHLARICAEMGSLMAAKSVMMVIGLIMMAAAINANQSSVFLCAAGHVMILSVQPSVNPTAPFPNVQHAAPNHHHKKIAFVRAPACL